MGQAGPTPLARRCYSVTPCTSEVYRRPHHPPRTRYADGHGCTPLMAEHSESMDRVSLGQQPEASGDMPIDAPKAPLTGSPRVKTRSGRAVNRLVAATSATADLLTGKPRRPRPCWLVGAPDPPHEPFVGTRRRPPSALGRLLKREPRTRPGAPPATPKKGRAGPVHRTAPSSLSRVSARSTSIRISSRSCSGVAAATSRPCRR